MTVLPPVAIRFSLMCFMVLSGSVDLKAETPRNPSPITDSVRKSEPSASAYHPLAGLEQMVHSFDPDPEQETNLKEFEADLQASLDSGWVPTWKHLEIGLSDQEIQALPTKKLAEDLFRSGLPARTLLLFNHSHVGIKRLEMLYPGYAELFRRPDVADGLNAIIAMRIDQLISGDPDGGISAGIDLGIFQISTATPPYSRSLMTVTRPRSSPRTSEPFNALIPISKNCPPKNKLSFRDLFPSRFHPPWSTQRLRCRVVFPEINLKKQRLLWLSITGQKRLRRPTSRPTSGRPSRNSKPSSAKNNSPVRQHGRSNRPSAVAERGLSKGPGLTEEIRTTSKGPRPNE